MRPNAGFLLKRRARLAAALCFVLPMYAQPQTDPGGGTELQRGFRQVELGTSFENVQELLREDPAFSYRGEPDVSLRLSDAQTVIDTQGRGFVDRGILQFADGELYSLALYLDRSQLSYFQLYEALRESYGEPADLDPTVAMWEDRITRIELERPLTVRYLDLQTLEDRRRASQTAEAVQDVNRDEFLEEF